MTCSLFHAQDLEKELVDSIECLRQAGIILEKYTGPENEACYYDKINEIVEHFGRLYSMRDAASDRVPVKVIEEYLDKGLNPDLYTKHRLKHAEALNQASFCLSRDPPPGMRLWQFSCLLPLRSNEGSWELPPL
jgi:hypothetical protein